MRALIIGGCALMALAIVGEAGAQSRGSSSGGFGGPTYGTGSNPNSNSVEGYINKNGTYVQPYERTNGRGGSAP